MSASYKLSDYYKGVTAAIYVGEVAAVLSGKISKQLNNPPPQKKSVALVRERNIPLWSSGQSIWLKIQSSRVRFQALPDFLSSSGSGTGSNQPREVN